MSSTAISVKRHNHRVHPCKEEQKQELLKLLLKNNSDKSILIVTSKHLESIQNIENEKIKVLSDESILKFPDLKCELLISYDLPDTAIEYMVRLAHTTTHALILLDEKEHKQLYPIETLLGRSLMQESIEGFGPEVQKEKPFKEKKEYSQRETKKEYKPRDEKREYKPRDDKFKSNKKFDNSSKEEKKPWKKPDYSKDKDSSDSKSNKYSKQGKPASKFLGKDENGKAIFSGKSRERNHRYDGTPKDDSEKVSSRRRTGRKINIKAIKPKEDKDS